VGVYGWAARSGWPFPYNLGAVVRRNHLHNNAHVEVSGACAEVVVENNRIERADAGVVVDGGSGVLLRGNQFAEVRAPYTGAALPQAYLSPMERTEVQLEALRTLLQQAGLQEDPAHWPEVKARLREGEAPAEPQILTAALAHVARLCPDGLPLQSLAPLLGLRLEAAPESPLHELIQSGRGGTGDLTLRASVPADGLPLPVEAQVQAAPGWTVERTPDLVPLKPGEAVLLTVTLSIPPGTWGGHELPVTVGLVIGSETLRLHSRVTVGSGFLRDWMVIGPFPNKTGSPLDLTLHPPDDGVDLRAEYDGLKGKVRWQPAHVTGNPLDLKALLQPAEPAVAYAVACVEAEGETPAVLRLGSSGGVALLLNGQPVWSVDQSRAAAPDQDRLPLTLRAGDNVLLFKVCTVSDQWQFIAELAPPPGGFAHRLRVVPPEEFAGRAAFAPPPPRPSLPEGGEVKHASGVTWQPLYADDFERAALGARWRAARGTWTVENGAATARDIAFLAYAEPIIAPLRIEYDARARTPGDLSAFWLDDPADYGTGYLMGFGSNGNTVDKVLISGEQVATSPKPLVEPGRWHHVIAQILPTGRIQIIVDDQMALDYPAAPPPAGPKFVGLWVWGPQGEFDNVRIYGRP
jgi:hypothetical protein